MDDQRSPEGDGIVRCPTSTHMPGGTPHSIIGCGSTNVQEDDPEPGMFDCRDCGIFFTREEARRG